MFSPFISTTLSSHSHQVQKKSTLILWDTEICSEHSQHCWHMAISLPRLGWTLCRAVSNFPMSMNTWSWPSREQVLKRLCPSNLLGSPGTKIPFSGPLKLRCSLWFFQVPYELHNWYLMLGQCLCLLQRSFLFLLGLGVHYAKSPEERGEMEKGGKQLISNLLNSAVICSIFSKTLFLSKTTSPTPISHIQVVFWHCLGN